VIDTVACADTDGAAPLVAVIVTDPDAGTEAGAVYRPLLLIVPTVLLPEATPFTFQDMDWSAVPCTVAANFRVKPVRTVACKGERVMLMPGITVTLAVPKADGVLLLAASTITVAGEGTVGGAK
jgi:hypothetical protein